MAKFKIALVKSIQAGTKRKAIFEFYKWMAGELVKGETLDLNLDITKIKN